MALGRPVLTRLLVPKTTCENVEKSSSPTRRRLPQTRTKIKVISNATFCYGLSCLTNRSDRHKILLLTVNLNRNGKTKLGLTILISSDQCSSRKWKGTGTPSAKSVRIEAPKGGGRVCGGCYAPSTYFFSFFGWQ